MSLHRWGFPNDITLGHADVVPSRAAIWWMNACRKILPINRDADTDSAENNICFWKSCRARNKEFERRTKISYCSLHDRRSVGTTTSVQAAWQPQLSLLFSPQPMLLAIYTYKCNSSDRVICRFWRRSADRCCRHCRCSHQINCKPYKQ